MNEIFTYYENLEKFERQNEILKYWEKTWQQKGFKTFIANKDHAKVHPLYQEFVDAVQEINRKKYKVDIRAFYLSSLVRWLAWSTLLKRPSYVCDYDVLNLEYTEQEKIEKGFTFRNKFCLCFASADSEDAQYFCKMIIDNKDLISENLETDRKAKSFHDQDVACILHKHQPNFKYKILNLPIGSPASNSPLIHFSHHDTKKLMNDYKEETRINLIKKRLQFHI
jgi:hypothetical protein